MGFLKKIFFFVAGAMLILFAVVMLTEKQILLPIFLGCTGLAFVGEAVNSARMVKFYVYIKLAMFFLLIISFAAVVIDAAFGTSLHESFKIFIKQL